MSFAVATRSFRLTKRDVQLLKALHSFGLLTTPQLAHLVFPSLDMRLVLRRLRCLRRRGVIARDGGLSGGPFIWQITEKGAKLIGGGERYGSINRNILEHEVMLSELRLRLTEARLVSLWRPGFEIRRSIAVKRKGDPIEEPLVPDAIFAGTSPKIMTTAVELELVPKSRRRYEKVFQAYTTKKGIQVLWYVVRSEGLGKKLMALWAKTAGRSSPITFGYSLADEVLSKPEAAALYTAEKVHLLGEVYGAPRRQPQAPSPRIESTRAEAP